MSNGLRCKDKNPITTCMLQQILNDAIRRVNMWIPIDDPERLGM